MRRTLALLLLAAATLTAASPVNITILATTDLHGNLTPVDYVTNQPASRGLARIATLVRQVRAASPNTLLIDCGDTIQGTPLESVYQAGGSTLGDPRGDPMMRAMNLLRYDAMTVGNHEYNVGLANLARARSDADFPWISANTIVAPGGVQRPYEPFIVKTVAGVKIAIIGITTPVIPMWEKPENLGAYRFTPPIEALRAALATLRRDHHPDLVIVAAHSGLGRNLETGAPDEPADAAEKTNAAALREVPPEFGRTVFDFPEFGGPERYSRKRRSIDAAEQVVHHRVARQDHLANIRFMPGGHIGNQGADSCADHARQLVAELRELDAAHHVRAAHALRIQRRTCPEDLPGG